MIYSRKGHCRRDLALKLKTNVTINYTVICVNSKTKVHPNKNLCKLYSTCRSLMTFTVWILLEWFKLKMMNSNWIKWNVSNKLFYSSHSRVIIFPCYLQLLRIKGKAHRHKCIKGYHLHMPLRDISLLLVCFLLYNMSKVLLHLTLIECQAKEGMIS